MEAPITYIVTLEDALQIREYQNRGGGRDSVDFVERGSSEVGKPTAIRKIAGLISAGGIAKETLDADIVEGWLIGKSQLNAGILHAIITAEGTKNAN